MLKLNRICMAKITSVNDNYKDNLWEEKKMAKIISENDYGEDHLCEW